MFAVIAAILFGLALLFDLLKTHVGISPSPDSRLAGLLFFALHFASTDGWSRGRYRR